MLSAHEKECKSCSWPVLTKGAGVDTIVQSAIFKGLYTISASRRPECAEHRFCDHLIPYVEDLDM